MSRKSSVQPRLEQLEARQVLSTASFSGGFIRVVGTAAADRVEVRKIGDNANERILVIDNGRVILNVAADPVERVTFVGGAGNDVFINRSGNRAIINGGAGRDRLFIERGDVRSPFDASDIVTFLGGSGGGGSGGGGGGGNSGRGGGDDGSGG